MGKYIERDKIKFHRMEFEERCHNDVWTEYEDIAYKSEIDSIHAADVRPVVHGRWIWQDAPCFGNPYGSYKCECGCLMPHKTNFCPNCGADMRVES